jgi:hypothetical protein
VVLDEGRAPWGDSQQESAKALWCLKYNKKAGMAEAAWAKETIARGRMGESGNSSRVNTLSFLAHGLVKWKEKQTKQKAGFIGNIFLFWPSYLLINYLTSLILFFGLPPQPV